MSRIARLTRTTSETDISLSLDLDGSGRGEIGTGIGFLDHMLTALTRHALFDLTVVAKGDLHIDFHHTAEDVGIVLGRAFAQALGDKRGIRRFGQALVPIIFLTSLRESAALAECLDAGGDDFGYCAPGFLHRVKAGEKHACNLRFREELDCHFSGDSKHPFGSSEECKQVKSRAV
mgnify:CR=1 FL=1